MAWRHRIHGLVIASETRLPLPEATGGSSDDAGISFRVALRPPGTERAEHRRTDDPDDPWVVEHWVGGLLVVEFPGWAAFETAPESITLLSDETGDRALVEHLLLDHVLPRAIALRGDLMLHASGVVGADGTALCFLGRTGTGKSTLAAALAGRGLPLLDDDGIRITTVDGVLVAMPGAPTVRLLPETARTLVPGVIGRPVSAGSRKYRFDVAGALPIAARPVPVGAVHLLERGPEAATLEPLALGEAIAAVADHGFHVDARPNEITRRVFEQAAALAAAAAVQRLRVPEGLDRIGAVADILDRLPPAVLSDVGRAG